ncbi:MAG: potassium channel family protein [Clostridium sp.]|uniref:potassium channel family protein n=1 Tax=Clostridium sp. TaxID=1506 RepID=UPI002FC635DE
MRKIKLLWNVLRSVDGDKIFLGFIGFLAIIAFFIGLVEPDIQGYSNALWYCFAVVTTIGFGDMVAVTTVGRILTVILSMYGILIVALIPGIVVSYFNEFKKKNEDETTSMYLDKLERLNELSKDELTELSSLIKKRRYKL